MIWQLEMTQALVPAGVRGDHLPVSAVSYLLLHRVLDVLVPA